MSGRNPVQSPVDAGLDRLMREGLASDLGAHQPPGGEGETEGGEWTCAMCYYENSGSNVCAMCGAVQQPSDAPEVTQKVKKPKMDDKLPRPCDRCSFLNPPNMSRCDMCQMPLGANPWKCARCNNVVSELRTECATCGMARPSHTLPGRPVEAGVVEVHREVQVTSDWPLFEEAVRWVSEVSGCKVDISNVVSKGAVDCTGDDGEIFPQTRKGSHKALTVLKEGDTVRTAPFDEQMQHQRCGWGKHMTVFCDQEAVLKRILVNEQRAQALVRFKNVRLDDSTQVPEDRRDQGWFDYEWLICPEGTCLPEPPGGWFEKLQRFPLRIGDTVRVKPYHPNMQRMKCGWDARMKDLPGKAGTILRIMFTAKVAQVNLGFSLAQGRTAAWWDIEWLDIPPHLVKRDFTHFTTGVCSGMVTLHASNARLCPGGHECRWVTNPYKQRGGTVECEGCRSVGIKDEEVLHCEICDFDLCQSCASGERVLDRAEAAIRSLSTIVRIGELPEVWIDPISQQIATCNESGAKVSMMYSKLKDGRPALHICVMGDAVGVATMLEGPLLCRIHDRGHTAGGTVVTNPITNVDPSILHAIERAFACSVVTPDPTTSMHPGTVALLGPREDRTKAAGKLVWYSASRKVIVRVHPSEQSIVQRKIREIRENAKCHVSIEEGAMVKLIGLPAAIKAARMAITELLQLHRLELQKQRVDKAMHEVVSELCEVKVAVPIAKPLRDVLSQLHEPTTSKQQVSRSMEHTRRRKEVAEQQSRVVRRRIQEELTEIHRTARRELSELELDDFGSDIAIPTNIAGIRAFQIGDRVVRGPDWDWNDQDGGAGQVGRVFDFPVRHEMHEGGLVDGWVGVEWPNHQRFNYRIGREQDVVHAAQEGEKWGEDGNDEEQVTQRLVRHKQAYLHLVNNVGTLEVQHQNLLANGEDDPAAAPAVSRRDTLQQWLHQTTRDKARVEHAVSACAASLDREEERGKETLSRLNKSLKSSHTNPLTSQQLSKCCDIMTQHLENLRSLRARMHRHSDMCTMQLTSRSAKMRRALTEEMQRQKFSGWDIILSIMQETGAFIEYKAGDKNLVLTGSEAAVKTARSKLRSLTIKDLYAWRRAAACFTVPPQAFTQLTRLQGLLQRIVEQVSGVESVTPEAPNKIHLKGTRPQIDQAVEVLKKRLRHDPVDLIWEAEEPAAGSEIESLVVGDECVSLGSLCDGCCLELNSSNTVTLLCGHYSLCALCLRVWADQKLAERHTVLCPMSECRHTLTAGEFRDLVARTEDETSSPSGDPMTEYEIIMAKERLNPQVRQCPSCNEGFAVRSGDGDMVPIVCSDCAALICPNASCNEAAHYFLDCAEVVPKRRELLVRRKNRLQASGKAESVKEIEAVLQRLDETAATQKVLAGEMDASGETRPCPKCGALVHKTGGCNSMTCNCGQKFCHSCLQTNCEAVEVPGPKTKCDPERLKERITKALAAHAGNTMYKGWVACDICDAYPIEKVFGCSNCVNFYACGECEASGAIEQQHDPTHLVIELAQVPEGEQQKVEPPTAGPDYTIDWQAIYAACFNREELQHVPSFGSGDGKDTLLPRIPTMSIEPITPLSSTLEPPPAYYGDVLEPPPLPIGDDPLHAPLRLQIDADEHGIAIIPFLQALAQGALLHRQ